MKKNNTSLRNKLVNSKFDFVKNLKWFFLASCIVIIAGIFTIIFAGFNLGMDFTGGTAINIQLGESIETDKGYNDALDKINNVMQENNLKLSSSQKEGEGAELSIIIKYQDIKGYSEEQMEEVSTSLVVTRSLLKTYLPINSTNPKWYKLKRDKDIVISGGDK